MNLETMAITERGYEHKHKIGQWVHSTEGGGRTESDCGSVPVDIVLKAPGQVGWEMLSIDYIHRTQRWIPRTVVSASVHARLPVCNKEREREQMSEI